jgi:hypothetical protein
MKTQMGEYVVGAYLQKIQGCDFVDYNVRPPSGGPGGLAEFDVVGFDFRERRVYLCEVVTHLDGMKYGSNAETIQRIRDKLERQRWYAETYLADFREVHLMLWYPVVSRGFLADELSRMEGLELRINSDYTACVAELKKEAKRTTRDAENPFFRALQILERMRD